MITQEQAEQAVIAARSWRDETHTRTVSIIELKRVNLFEDTIYPSERYTQETIDWEPYCWSCTFAYTDSFPDGRIEGPFHGYCYVVEPKPGPYVIK